MKNYTSGNNTAYILQNIKNYEKDTKRSSDTQIGVRSRGTPNLCIETRLTAKSVNGYMIYTHYPQPPIFSYINIFIPRDRDK